MGKLVTLHSPANVSIAIDTSQIAAVFYGAANNVGSTIIVGGIRIDLKESFKQVQELVNGNVLLEG